jgi:hypothetical protein
MAREPISGVIVPADAIAVIAHIVRMVRVTIFMALPPPRSFFEKLSGKSTAIFLEILMIGRFVMAQFTVSYIAFLT